MPGASEEARRFEIYLHQTARFQGGCGGTVYARKSQSADPKHEGVRWAENGVFQSGGVFHRSHRNQK
jgi:hypothetical protein